MSIEEEVAAPAKTQTRPTVFTFIEFGKTAQAELQPWADIVIGPVKDTAEWYEQAATFDEVANLSDLLIGEFDWLVAGEVKDG